MSDNDRIVYGPHDLRDWDPERTLGTPGSFPYTRGPYPTMYTERLWTMRQYAGFGDAAATNERFRTLLEAGQTGLSVAFDLPTQMGLDSDDAMAAGEVGKVGVAIDSIDDMRRLFDRIPLGDVTTSMTINSTAPILLLLYASTLLAGEGTMGTFRMVLVRPITRTDLLLAKVLLNLFKLLFQLVYRDWDALLGGSLGCSEESSHPRTRWRAPGVAQPFRQ